MFNAGPNLEPLRTNSTLAVYTSSLDLVSIFIADCAGLFNGDVRNLCQLNQTAKYVAGHHLAKQRLRVFSDSPLTFHDTH